MIITEEFVFQLSTIDAGEVFFVTNALKDDLPLDENGYLVMVNEFGDRVAYRAPGQDWVRDSKVITSYNTQIPTYKNALRIPKLPLEND